MELVYVLYWGMFRYSVDSPTFLKETILALEDDLSLPWNTYPCLPWPRVLYKDGYGAVYKFVNGKKTTRRAHREAWELIHGRIPTGILICHHCDNPPCFRPIHLFAGGNSENMKDCVAKGRYVNVAKTLPGCMRRGEDHGIAKLTAREVLEIRSRYIRRTMSQSMLAREYEVSQTLIGHIVRRNIWKHI